MSWPQTEDWVAVWIGARTERAETLRRASRGERGGSTSRTSDELRFGQLPSVVVPTALCRLTDLWLALTGAILLGCYLAGR